MKELLILPVLLVTNELWSQQPRLTLPIGHTKYIYSAEYSPDGKYIITAADDETAKIWRIADGRLLIDLHPGKITSARYSPDGKTILTLSKYTCILKIWNADDGKLIREMKLSDKFEINSVTYSPDGKSILACGYGIAKAWNASTGKLLYELRQDGEVRTAHYSPDGITFVTITDEAARIWNTADGKLLKELKQSDQTRDVLYSPDGKFIVTVYDKIIRVWDPVNWKLIKEWEATDMFTIRAMYSPDGKAIITSSYDKVRVWNPLDGTLQKELDHDDKVQVILFSPGGNLLVTISGKIIKVWNAQDLKLITAWEAHNAGITSASFSPDGKYLLSTDENDTGRIWDIAKGTLRVELKGQVTLATYSPDGRYILTADRFTSAIWNATDGKLQTRLKGHTYRINSSIFSPDGKYIASASGDRTTKIWDVADGKLQATLKGHANEIKSVFFSPDGKKIVTASYDNSAKIWDASSGRLLLTLDGEKTLDGETKRGVGWIMSARYSPDGKYIVTASQDHYANIWDAESGKLLVELKHDGAVESATYSRDGKYVITRSKFSLNSLVSLWDAVSGELVKQMTWPTEILHIAQFSPDGKWILTVDYSDTIVRIWNPYNTSSKPILELKGHKDYINSANYSSDGKYILTSSDDNTAKIWNAANGKLLRELKGHTGPVRQAVFSADDKYILSAADDNTLKKWDAATGKLIYSFFAVDSSDYFLLIPKGYYMCTQNAARQLYYVKGLQTIGFEQLDIKYNRPDKVLEAIGNKDTALIKAYRKAYYKRIKKLGIDTTAFRDGYSIPEADFLNREKIEYTQTEEKLTLHINGMDSAYVLDRFNVWVNEVPVFGLKGINVHGRNMNKLDTSITIILSSGENKIETSVMNVNGTESYRMPLYVKYAPVKQKDEKVYFLGIGINHFADSKNDLRWSVKDIRDMALKLKEKYKDSILIDTLFDENVNISKVKSLKKKLENASVNDKVVIAYSGHGLLSKDYDYYLSTYPINFEKPEQDGLAYDELESLLDSIPARKKLMLIDACHSGEVDKEELGRMQQVAKNSNDTTKGIILYVDTTHKRVGMKNSFELMQELFVNVGKSTGATIISAAGGTQFAQEKSSLKNGVFTYSVIEAFNNNSSLKVSELKRIVGERVVQLTNGAQKPTSRNENIDFDWAVW